MNKIFRAAFFAFAMCALFCSNAATLRAQENNQKSETSKESFEIVLQLLKSNAAGETGNAALPSNLQSVGKKLRADFGSGDYSLMLTLLNRVAERGSLELKSVSSFNVQQSESKSLNYYELSLGRIQPNGVGAIEAQNLRFGIRMPVATFVANNGNSTLTTNYEQFGITVSPLRIDLNEPTIVGTLTTSRQNELLVLVMTVKPENRATAKQN